MRLKEIQAEVKKKKHKTEENKMEDKNGGSFFYTIPRGTTSCPRKMK